MKLGTGGLNRAYGHMTKQVIDTAALQPYIEMATLHFTLNYERFQSFDYPLKKLMGKLLSKYLPGKFI